MAPLALLGRGLVEEDVLAFDQPNLFVAACAADVLVQTLQGKRSSPVVVE